MKLTVTRDAIRQYIREIFTTPGVGWQSTGDLSTSPASISAVVDPSAALTNPGNPNFIPSSRKELEPAVSSLIGDISDDDAAEFYDRIKSSIENLKDEEENMSKQKNVEETIRRSIRKMLREAGPYRDTGMSYSGPMIGSRVRPGFEECEACEGEGMLDDGTDCKVCKGTGMIQLTGRKNVMMTDVGGASFEDIAKEMGYAAASGARQAVDRALEKAKFTASMDPDELEITTLTAMNDYISVLNKSGELTSADVQLLRDHPGIISQLDGFREFLDSYIKKAMKTWR